jgi:hypothetical protein
MRINWGHGLGWGVTVGAGWAAFVAGATGAGRGAGASEGD